MSILNHSHPALPAEIAGRIEPPGPPPGTYAPVLQAAVEVEQMRQRVAQLENELAAYKRTVYRLERAERQWFMKQLEAHSREAGGVEAERIEEVWQLLKSILEP